MNAQRQKQRFRRPATWDRSCSGLPVALAQAQGEINMPPGLRHVSDYAAPALANPAVQVVEAIHSSGTPFTLLIAPTGQILAVSAGTTTGLRKIGMSDPTGWARRQTWHLQPVSERVAP